MISRVADHCFWLGRYLERAESTARVLHVTSTLALDLHVGASNSLRGSAPQTPDTQIEADRAWMPVVIVFGQKEHFAGSGAWSRGTRSAPGAPSFTATRANGANGANVQAYMTWDEENVASIARSIGAARENARAIRDVVSLEVWESVNELYLFVRSQEGRDAFETNRWGFYRRIRVACEQALGFMASTMLHDTPLDFIWLGMMLERTGQTARNLDVHHHVFTTAPDLGEVMDTALWLGLLRACSGFEPFMKRHRGRVTGSAVASFLILEPAFPRSVRHSLQEAYERLCAIRPPAEYQLPGGRSVERLGVLRDWVADLVPGQLTPETIHPTLTRVVDDTARVCATLGAELFNY